MRRLIVAVGLAGAVLGWAGPVGAEADDHGYGHTIKLSMTEASCFQADFSAYPYITFYGVGDHLNLKPFGASSLDWDIVVLATATGFDFVNGAFAFTLPNHDKLTGDYTGFSIDVATGAYTVDWLFTDGTGALEDAHGKGKTNGVTNLATLCANFTFKGKVKVDGQHGEHDN